jgi:hypothetical protein
MVADGEQLVVATTIWRWRHQAMSDPFEQLREEFDQAVVERVAFWEVKGALRYMSLDAPSDVFQRWKRANEEWKRTKANVDEIAERMNKLR